MSERTIGTCSVCGGAVTVPAFWHGIHPPTPSCLTCGATPMQPYGPVIPMRPRQPSWSPSWQQAVPVREIIWGPVPVTPSLPTDGTGLPYDFHRYQTTIS